MNIEDLRIALTQRLAQELPGYNAHYKLAPYRYQPGSYDIDMSTARKSGVLVLLYNFQNEWHTVLMERSIYKGAHSGQISFPGGKVEENDKDITFTALREANEELGIHSNKVQIIGPMTDLFIPGSNFFVQPILGIHSSLPIFCKEEKEVQSIIEFPLRQLLMDNLLKSKKLRHSNNLQIDTPYFDVYGHVVWGATGMMLSELKDILKEIGF